MRKIFSQVSSLSALAALVCGISLPTGVRAEELKREQNLSDLENKPAPALKVSGWMNTPDGKPLNLPSLKGKVVVLDFWGTW